MEKIKKALERAKEQRETESPDEHGPENSSSEQTGQQPSVTNRPADGEQVGEQPINSDGIVYTQTRSVKVSRSVLQANRVVTGDEGSAYSDAYKVLRTQVIQRMRENNWNTLAVTSPGQDAGKTLTAVNIAIAIAREIDRTVLLVDADLRKPSVHNLFGLQPECGLSDYLLNDTPIEDILINPGIDKLVFLPGGRPLTNSSEMLDSPKMSRLVDDIKGRYSSRIIIFDMPPLLMGDDTLAFSPYVDAALLVIEEGKTERAQVERSVELLHSTNLIGSVLNKSTEVTTNAYPY